MESPSQIDASGPAVAVRAPTFTVIVPIMVQGPLMPVTVYVVVAAGEAVTLDPVVALRPVAGLHV